MALVAMGLLIPPRVEEDNAEEDWEEEELLVEFRWFDPELLDCPVG